MEREDHLANEAGVSGRTWRMPEDARLAKNTQKSRTNAEHLHTSIIIKPHTPRRQKVTTCYQMLRIGRGQSYMTNDKGNLIFIF